MKERPAAIEELPVAETTLVYCLRSVSSKPVGKNGFSPVRAKTILVSGRPVANTSCVQCKRPLGVNVADSQPCSPPSRKRPMAMV
jgi:hypothetical protein